MSILPDPRSILPYAILALVLGGVAWAVSFGTLPPADFTFINGTEIESVDPAVVTGSPEGRIMMRFLKDYFTICRPECLENLMPVVKILSN